MSKKQSQAKRRSDVLQRPIGGEARLRGLGVPLAMLVPAVLCHGSAPIVRTQETRTSQRLAQLSSVLSELEAKIRSAAAETTQASDVAASADAVDQAVQSIEAMLAKLPGAVATEPEVAAVVQSVTCIVPGEQANIFLSLSAAASFLLDPFFHVFIIGNQGSQQFTFVSGTSVSSVAEAINQFTAQTGVEAESLKGESNPFRVKLKSSLVGDDQFVAAIVTSDPLPLLYAHPWGGTGETSLVDLGEAPIVPWSATPQ